MAERPVEVAIVGGGCGAMATAFELSRPEHRGKYHVTVYQLGWRLGGKGASGRGPGQRIEEHGLHIWLGFYENAFRLMRQCYEELDRDPGDCRIAHWRDAFYPDPHVAVADPSADGWLNWMAYFPPRPGAPGDPLDDHNPFTMRSYLRRSAELIVVLLGAVRRREAQLRCGGKVEDRADDGESPGGRPAEDSLLDAVGRLLKFGVAATAGGLIQAAHVLAMLVETLPRQPAGPVLQVIDAVADAARQVVEERIGGDDELRRLWEILDLVLAILRGAVRFGLATDPRGFDALDDYECREWLLMNGASEASVRSAFVRGLYDLALAYEEGDTERPVLAAGQALRGAARMFFTYRGSLFWKMRAGMGDVVFAPFYEVLRRRGVTFRFFHRLEDVRLATEEQLAAGETPHVTALEFDVQAHPVGGDYDPLVDVDGLPCWPAEPVWQRLEDGETLRAEGRGFEDFWDRRRVERKVLKVGEDFDCVVLAVGLGAVPHVASELIERDPRWRRMVEEVKTVASQAFQVWLSEDMEALGWPGPPVTISGFVQPFDTWADMRQLLPEERFSQEPRALAYFCSVLDDPEVIPPRRDDDFPARERERVRHHAVEFLNRHIHHLWPRAVERDEEGRQRFRWGLLVDAEASRGDGDEPQGEDRFAGQFWTANVNPSDRYVLCPPGSPRHRISPLDRTYDNLTLAGDWTSCGFNEGCVEAAVMSGRLAAHAIALEPPLEEIIGYDHP